MTDIHFSVGGTLKEGTSEASLPVGNTLSAVSEQSSFFLPAVPYTPILLGIPPQNKQQYTSCWFCRISRFITRNLGEYSLFSDWPARCASKSCFWARVVVQESLLDSSATQLEQHQSNMKIKRSS